MDRRDALKGIGLLFAAPALIKIDMLMKMKSTSRILIATDFTIDTCGTIRYTGVDDKMYTVWDLYQYLMSLPDEDPVLDGTPHMMELQSPYHINDKTAERLTDGTIIQDNGYTIYSHIKELI